MIRLNLGCGAPGERSWHPIDGWINRDPALDGWRFEHGLGEYADGSVEAISVSHSTMYVALADWPRMFAEFARVLCDEGVLRITEDDTQDTRSRTYPKGWHDVVTLTHREMVKQHMRQAGLVAEDCDAVHSNFRDFSILQDQHGGAPHCFYVEGCRRTRVLFEPHADDAGLFAAFTVLKYRPRIVTCFGSSGDYGDTATRARETIEAMSILGGGPCVQWNGGDLTAQMRDLDASVKPSLVFAPNERASHPDHVAVALAAREVFGDRLRTYHTYDERGKVREGRETPFEPEWVLAKLRALARYESQVTHARACRFFLGPFDEYLGE